jgi:hypothetical protein
VKEVPAEADEERQGDEEPQPPRVEGVGVGDREHGHVRREDQANTENAVTLERIAGTRASDSKSSR